MSASTTPRSRATISRACLQAFAAALALGAVLVPPDHAEAFGTIRSLGQNAEHEMITRAALDCHGGSAAGGACFEPRSIGSLAGETGTVGAVGAPDIPPEAARAHCDDADYLHGVDPPSRRAAATAELAACRRHLVGRFRQGIRDAGDMLDNKDRLIKSEVDLSSRSCTFVGGFRGRAKCNALEGIGRALHGVQDFYSHSNWADESDPGRPIGPFNPPGLGRGGLAPLLALRATTMPPVPRDLATGCFSLTDRPCRGRITHSALAKDYGTINPITGAAVPSAKVPAGRPKPPSGPARSLVGTNFQRAVAASVADTRRQWDDFKAELRSHWGAKRANLMICALTRDDPMKDCTGRKLGIVVDSSGSNQDTDPGNLRITAAQSFNAGLVTEAQAGPDERPDLSTVIDFDDSARVISPLADPAQASFAGIDSEGGTDIGSGVNAAIGELTKDGEGETKDRTGIVVLTDGLDGGSSLPGALAQAASLGIRVNFGFLSPPANPVPAAARASAARGERPIGRAAQSGSDQPPELVRAILATGGFYGVIDSAESQRKFVDLVLAHGATALDDPNGLDDGGALIPGVRATGLLGAGEVDTWSYAPAPGRHVTVTATSRDGSPLVVRVHDVRRGVGAAEAGGNPASATARVRGRTDLEIRVSGATGLYTVEVAERGTELRGTPGADRLRCTDEPTYVTAGAGRDRVRCGGDADLIVGGRGADRLRGAGGDDVFLIRRGALRRGIERISGGAGHDEVDFGFRRPRTVQCAVGRRTVVGLGRARFLVTGVERLTFQGRPCGRVRRAP